MRVIEQRTMIEGQRTTVDVLSTMHQAAKTAQDNMKTMKIENVDKVLDEINETTDQMRQINEVGELFFMRYPILISLLHMS